jgi:hypothetical protein
MHHALNLLVWVSLPSVGVNGHVTQLSPIDVSLVAAAGSSYLKHYLSCVTVDVISRVKMKVGGTRGRHAVTNVLTLFRRYICVLSAAAFYYYRCAWTCSSPISKWLAVWSKFSMLFRYGTRSVGQEVDHDLRCRMPSGAADVWRHRFAECNVTRYVRDLHKPGDKTASGLRTMWVR